MAPRPARPLLPLLPLLLLALAAWLALPGGAGAYTAFLPVTASPGRPGQCLDPRSGQFFGPGDTWTRAGECVRYSCSFPNIAVHGCGSMEVEAPCVLEADPLQPFPDCCPRPRCPDADNELDAGQ